MRRPSSFLTAGLLSAVALFSGSSAEAAEPHFLAYLDNQHAELWAYADDTGRWCRPDAALSLLLKPQNRLSHFEKVLSQIGVLFARQCPQALSATVAIYLPDRSLAGPSTVIRKASHWAAAPPPADARTAEAGPTPKTAPAAAAPAPLPAPPPTPAPLPEFSPAATAAASSAPPPSSSPAAAPEARTDAVSAAGGEPTAVAPLEIAKDYPGLLLRYLRDKPDLAQNADSVRWWAAYRYGEEFRRLQNQEFKIAPVLERAKADLAASLAKSDPERIVVVLATQFGSYDFSRQMFPLSLGGIRSITVSAPWTTLNSKLPSQFTLAINDLDAITGVPMPNAEAQVFVEKRTRWGAVDRSVHLALTVKIAQEGFSSSGWGTVSAPAVMVGAAIYADRDLSKTLSNISGQDLEVMRAAREIARAAEATAEGERKAEMQRRQLLAQREQDIKILATSPPSTKLFNFISTGPLNLYSHLNDLRTARGNALLHGKPQDVAMLVQTDSSGRQKVATKWPGNLEISLPEALPKLESNAWYLVQGVLTVGDGDDFPPAQLSAITLYACTQPKCSDAMDATAILDRKLAMIAPTAQGGK